MKTGRILTPWVVADKRGATDDSRCNHPMLDDDYTMRAWCDVTGQPASKIPPSPNLFVVEATFADDIAAALWADAGWQPYILWLEGYHEPDQVPADAECTGQVNAFAAISGVTVQAIQGAIGATVAGRTRRTIAAAAVAFLRTL